VPACGPDSTGADAVLSRRRLRSVDTVETVVVRFDVVLESIPGGCGALLRRRSRRVARSSASWLQKLGVIVRLGIAVCSKAVIEAERIPMHSSYYCTTCKFSCVFFPDDLYCVGGDVKPCSIL